MTPQYARVAVDSQAPLKTYSYLVPPSLSLALGQAVWVPFGRKSAPVQGIVFGFDTEAPVAGVKPVTSAIGEQPLLREEDCRLAEWLSGYYFAPLFECAALMLPPGFRQRIRTVVSVAPDAEGRETRPLQGVAERIVVYLRKQDAPVDLDRLRRGFGANTDGAVERLERAGMVSRTSFLSRPSVAARYVRLLTLTPAGAAADGSEVYWGRAHKQRALVLELRARGGSATVDVLSEALGPLGTLPTLLAQRGFVEIGRQRVTRDPLAGRAFHESFAPPLTVHQEVALRDIRLALLGDGQRDPPSRSGLGSPPPPRFLVHGVTGSGKTELYLQALAACVAGGKKGIVLVPEIALEPQTVASFSARFPGRVAVLHSGVSAGEEYDEWWRVRSGEFDVVIGSRGAVFAPQPDLGLIVIDEEHEATYKQQDMAPRYDARRVGEERARLSRAVLIMGSATPDLGSYSAVGSGRFRLLELPYRVGQVRPAPLHPAGDEPPRYTDAPLAERRSDRGLAEVEVVDLREELKAGNRSIFSRALQDEMGGVLSRGQQAILFLNRRGTSSFIQCRDCGGVVRCSRCETPLTYHSAGERLICHQCNAHLQVPSKCRQCGSARIRFLGVGTQRVEAEVAAMFPEARVLRWDRDTAKNRRSHEAMLARFAGGGADVMVGTQMIAKGLDLPQVTLVGIVNADLSLYLPDFRAAERTFQLLTQVAGRSGRGEWPGRVIIQTYTPEHYAIHAAARQDYAGFVDSEMGFRERHGYPPAQPLIRLVYSDLIASRAQEETAKYGQVLSTERAREGRTDVQVVGPLPAYFRRVRGRYRWQVLLKGEGGRALIGRCPLPRGWVVDVDPLHIL